MMNNTQGKHTELKISKCQCGDDVCTKYRIDKPFNLSGLFEKEDAEYIRLAYNNFKALREACKEVYKELGILDACNPVKVKLFDTYLLLQQALANSEE